MMANLMRGPTVCLRSNDDGTVSVTIDGRPTFDGSATPEDWAVLADVLDVLDRAGIDLGAHR